MSAGEGLAAQLESTHRFFKTTLSVFEPANAAFTPDPELYTVAGHVAHAADSVDWLIEGGFGSGWDMDVEGLVAILIGQGEVFSL